MTRVKVSDGDWRSFRVLSVGLGIPVEIMLGDLIRERLQKEHDGAPAQPARTVAGAPRGG